MLARFTRSPLARSSPFGRLPPPFARSARSRQRLCLPWLRSARPPLQAFDLRFAVPLAPLVRSPFHSENKSGIFEKKERSRRTHIFPENGIFGFCSASAPQKQDLQKSTLHNTQLWCIFYPSAFGYGKCPITCVMYKPLRLWLRGSTFLQKLRPIDRLCRRSLVLRLVAPPARALLVRPPLQRSARPPLQAFVLRFPASARPPLQAFDLRRGRLRGDLPPLRLRLRLGRFAPLCSAPLLGWCSVSAPLRPCCKKKLQKALPFTIFFPTKHHQSNNLS